MTDTPAQEFREIGGRFGDVVAGVRPDQWDDPSPVEGWAARDVVRHLVEWFPSFLAAGPDVHLPAGPSVDDDPAGAWHTSRARCRRCSTTPPRPSEVLSNRHIGDVPLPQAVSRFFTGDVFMHTWDLARATGQDDTLDPERCAVMLAGMEPIEDVHARQRPVRRRGRGARRRGRADEDAGLHRPRSAVETAGVCLSLGS